MYLLFFIVNKVHYLSRLLLHVLLLLLLLLKLSNFKLYVIGLKPFLFQFTWLSAVTLTLNYPLFHPTLGSDNCANKKFTLPIWSYRNKQNYLKFHDLNIYSRFGFNNQLNITRRREDANFISSGKNSILQITSAASEYNIAFNTRK